MFALYLFHQFKVGTALEIGNRVINKINKTLSPCNSFWFIIWLAGTLVQTNQIIFWIQMWTWIREFVTFKYKSRTTLCHRLTLAEDMHIAFVYFYLSVYLYHPLFFQSHLVLFTYPSPLHSFHSFMIQYNRKTFGHKCLYNHCKENDNP